MSFLSMNEKQFTNSEIKKLLTVYVEILENNGAKFSCSHDLKKILERDEENLLTFSDPLVIKDPFFLLLVTMGESETSFSERILSFKNKCSVFVSSPIKHIKKNKSITSISDTIDKYIYRSPRKIKKSISNDETCEVTLNAFKSVKISPVLSPTLNY